MRSWPVFAYLAVNAVVLAWNLYVAGRIVNTRRGSPLFLGLTALAALLSVPAVLVGAASTTILSGRAIFVIEWVWPLVLGVCALQALQALVRGWVSPFLGIPAVACNTILCAAALARFGTTLHPDPPVAAVALGAAHANVLGFVLGRSALLSPLALQMPVLLPSFPARYRFGKTMRVAMAAWCALTAVLFIMEYPAAVHAAATYGRYMSERLQARPRGDFAIGLRILPDLRGSPPALAVREDLALVDSLDADAVSVILRPPGGASVPAVDSLSRALERQRRGNTLLVVALGYGTDDGVRFREDPGSYLQRRLELVSRVMVRLKPDILLPALDPYVEGRRALGDVPPLWWRAYLRDAATVAHEIRARTRVAVFASAFTAPDSELFAWAGDPSAPLDIVGLSLFPSYGGGSSLQARFHVAERWMRASRKPVWIAARGAYPRLFGDRNQARALWGTLAWATSQARVQGFIIDGAGDYDALTGLRAPGGRLRTALGMLALAKRTLAETSTTER